MPGGGTGFEEIDTVTPNEAPEALRGQEYVLETCEPGKIMFYSPRASPIKYSMHRLTI